MHVVKLTKSQMVNLLNRDAGQWEVLARSSAKGAQNFRRLSPLAETVRAWEAECNVCPRCEVQRCPDGCCCAC
jgi:hypothetical protein